MAPWPGLTATRAFFYKPSDGGGTYRFYTRTRVPPKSASTSSPITPSVPNTAITGSSITIQPR